MRLASVLVGMPRNLGEEGAAEPMQRAWTSAIHKEAVHGPVRLWFTGLAGDGQADTEHHGGADKAVLAYPRTHFEAWRRDLPHLDMHPGAFGENFSVDGADETSVCLGDVFRVGTTLVQVSQPRLPCWKLARRWGVKELSLYAQRSARVGWYLRVLATGEVRAGDVMECILRPHHEWTVLRAHNAMHNQKRDLDLGRSLLAVEALADSWKRVLQRRVEGEEMDPSERLVGPNEEGGSV